MKRIAYRQNGDGKHLRVRLREDMKAIIGRIGVTALFVTHDQEEALALSDRIVVMKQGRAEQIGTPGDIYESKHNYRLAASMQQSMISNALVRSSHRADYL